MGIHMEYLEASSAKIEMIGRKEWNREYRDGDPLAKGQKVLCLSGDDAVAIVGTQEDLEVLVDELHAAVFDVRNVRQRFTSEPLTRVAYDEQLVGWLTFCRDHGNVTPLESGFTMRSSVVTQEQAELYRRRHLAKHLAALSSEISEASR